MTTTLADLRTGDQFLFAAKVTDRDQVTGLTLALYGPGRVAAATSTISPAGVMAGQLADTPDKIPVYPVSGYAPVSVGDVLQNDKTGETMVVRWAGISADGVAVWSASVSRQVIYEAAGWTNIASVSLLSERGQCEDKTKRKKRRRCRISRWRQALRRA